nr:hypothetical protein [Tanacetum cinerariifolium]
NSKAYKEYYACATGEAAPKLKASARKKKGDSASSTTLPTLTPTTTVESAPRLSATAKGKQPAKAIIPTELTDVQRTKAEQLKIALKRSSKGKQPARATSPYDPSEVERTEAKQLKIVLRKTRQETHISQHSGSSTDEGTGSKPGVPDVPFDDSEEETSWNSSDDEDVDAQDKGRDDDEGNKNDENPSSSGQKDLVFVKSSSDDIKVSILGVERLWLSKVEGFILPKHDTGRILSTESQRNTTDPSVAVTDSSTTEYDSTDESSVCSTPPHPLKKLDGAEHISRPKTIKSILRSKSKFKAETLKGVTINEPSSAPAKVSSDQNGQTDQNDQSVQNDEILSDDHSEHSNHTSDEQIINNLPNTKDIQISEHSSSLRVEDTLAHNTIIIPNSSLSISSMVTPALQDRWYQDKHIELVNIIRNPGVGMLTRAMTKELGAASAHEYFFVDFLLEIRK